MAEHQLISPSQLQSLQRRGLGLAKSSSMALVYPAYLDLVRRQLKRDYSQSDLQTQGLRIYTTFDPIVQRSAERSLAAIAQSLDKEVEGAMVVTAVDRGDVLAVVGGRRMRFAGFNRALDAVRQIGSLAKPVVYLAALEQHQRYTLASTISDGPVVVEGRDGSRWQPRNFDRQNHGDVLLHRALAQSYNQATARLGMQLGLPAVTDMFKRLGAERPQPQVPALLLGAGAMTPIEVAQMYQTIAAGGIHRPLRAIVGIADKSGNTLARYPIQSSRVVDQPVVHLLHYSMMEVVREGTGKSVYESLPQDFDVAGKTGSSNDLRDSWFAGFAGDYLAVTWLGRDDNGSSGLTGAAGALKVWRQFMADSSRVPLNLSAPPGVVYEWVDNRNGLKANRLCEDSRYVPFIQGSTPQQSTRCQPSVPGVMKWFQGLF
jgi:penicillin-binding protein 1B